MNAFKPGRMMGTSLQELVIFDCFYFSLIAFILVGCLFSYLLMFSPILVVVGFFLLIQWKFALFSSRR